MNELVPLNIPAQLQVKVENVARECPSEGFNYPAFRQLNKHARIYLSEPLPLIPSTSYNLFDVANSKGWFVAVKQAPMGSSLIFSTLEDLRSSFPTAKDSPDNLFSPKRTVSTTSTVNIVKFACGDSRLLVSQDNGSILVFDTVQIFTEGINEIHPSSSTHFQTGYIQQIVPNPGTEPGLSDLIAVLSNGKVHLLNMDLEFQGGWAGEDLMSQPIAVSWSPKGKHIAIGLQTGDILTFSLTNKSTPHKHIPPTVDGILSSLNWLGPGHTFRTSYATQADSTPQQHIIILDAKSSTVTYFAPEHPFPCADRNYQNSYVIALSKWDTDSTDESKSLVVVGDACSIDLEVLGNSGNTWYRQSQENPLSLPLNSDMEDTVLVAFVNDLTDSATSAPIAYAYLNDGSLQGWHLEYSKPYAGMVTPISSRVITQNASQAQSQGDGKDDDMGAEETPASRPFSQPEVAPNALNQTSSQQSSATAFGQAGFGPRPSAFGQSSLGQPSAFGASATFGSPSPFSQPSQGTPSTSAFGAIKPATGFGAFAGTNNAFGNAGNGSSAFGSSSGAFGSTTSNAFGQGNFGSNTQSSTQTTSTSTTMTREASMSDSTSGFGNLGLGSAGPTDPNARNAMFGSFANPNPTSGNPTSGGGFGGGPLVKPATGFGAFGDTKPSSTFEAPKLSSLAFGATSSQTTATSGFGQSGFATPAFGKSAFGQPAFGQPSFGKPSLAAPSTSSSGGFGAFANKPASFTSSAQQVNPTAPGSSNTSGGFSSFASSGTSTFGTALSSTQISEPKTATQGSFGNLSVPSGNEGKPASSAFSGSALSGPATTQTSVFASPPAAPINALSKPPESNKAPSFSLPGTSPFATSARKSPFAREGSESPEPSSSPEPVKPPQALMPTAPATAPNAFSGLQSTPSAFKPAEGFGAFGSFASPSNSPFFKKPGETPAAVSAFALGPTTPTTPASTTAAPTFGAASALGSSKSVFAPITPASATPAKVPATGGFSAFSGASSSLSSYVAKKTSFAEVLNTGDDETKPPGRNVPKGGKETAPVKEEIPAASMSVFKPIAKNEDKKTEGKKPMASEPSFGSISASSTSSSFVNVTAEDESADEGPDEPPSDEDADHSGDDGVQSFLSDDDSDEDSGEDSNGNGLPSSPQNTDRPLSPTRSPSATPQPETPAIKVTPAKSDDDDRDEVNEEGKNPKSLSFTREASNTPPKTPATGSQPSTFASPATPSPFSLFGAAAMVNKPKQRSPLANAIHSEADDEEPEEGEVAENKHEHIAVPPKSPVAIQPVKLDDESAVKRPKTPPLLTTLGGKSPVASSSSLPAPTPSIFQIPRPPLAGPAKSEGSGINALGALAAVAASVPSIFSQPADSAPGESGPQRPATSPPNFFATPSLFPAPAQTSLFGKPFALPSGGAVLPSNATGLGAKPAQTPSFFSLQQSSTPLMAKTPGSSLPKGSLFGPPPTAPTNQSLGFKPASPNQIQQTPLEEGMQKECLKIIAMVANDFNMASHVLQAALEKRKEVAVSLGGTKLKSGLGNESKWGLLDLEAFGHVLLQYEADLTILQEITERHQHTIRELQNSMLKAKTRREEIARFNRAKNDKDFAKMLRSRTLGPEHSETQMQLRKAIRTTRDRIQKLELHLQEDKKKLAQFSSSKPSFKAPSLDTINRTFRNIELTIEQQAAEVTRLASLISELDIGGEESRPITKGQRRAAGEHTRSFTVTPNVAATTAAALNAERSARRLKHTLLRVRKEPLLNEKATAAPRAPVDFADKSKPDSVVFAAFGAIPEMKYEEISDVKTLSLWNDIPPDNFDPTGSSTLSAGFRGSSKSKKREHTPAPKVSPIPTPSSSASNFTPPGFEWGPLPNFSKASK